MIVGIDEQPDVVALIPTLGSSPDRLGATIDSLAAQSSSARLAIVCIVNAPESALATSDWPSTTVIVAGLNLGWAGALCFARTLVSAPFLWLIQDDLVCEPECLAALLERCEREPTLAMVSPVVIDESGLVRAKSAGGTVDDAGWMLRWLPADPTPADQFSSFDELSYVPSRGMLVRTEAWDRVGGLDPRYFPLIWTDVDFCTALARAGLAFALEVQARVHHESGASTPSALAGFLGSRNRELYRTKWFPTHVSPDDRDPSRPSRPEALTGAIDERVPRELIDTVAQCAADALLHLGRIHTCDIERLSAVEAALRDERAALRDESAAVRLTLSWRITAPLRRVRSWWI